MKSLPLKNKMDGYQCAKQTHSISESGGLSAARKKALMVEKNFLSWWAAGSLPGEGGPEAILG